MIKKCLIINNIYMAKVNQFKFSQKLTYIHKVNKEKLVNIQLSVQKHNSFYHKVNIVNKNIMMILMIIV